MFKRVLVTGGAGFIGSHMVDVLLERGCEVRVLDNLEPQVHGENAVVPEYLAKNIEFMKGDMRDRDAVVRAVAGCDAIVHDAAMVGVGQSQYQVHRYTDVNVGGTAMLLDVLVNEKHGIEKLLVASSMSIYGEGLYRRPSDGVLRTPALRPDSQMASLDFEMRDPETGEVLEAVPTPESKPLVCTSIYALGKKDQEEYCLCIGHAYKLPVVAARYFNVYGPRQALSNPYTGAAAIFSARIKNGNAPLIYEDGKQLRDFICVRDLVRAKLLLLEDERAIGGSFNIGTGRPTSILTLAKTLCMLYGRPDLEPQIVKKFRSGDIRHCYADVSKIHALGWRAQVPLEDGLRELAEWGEAQEARDQVEAAHRELEMRGLVSR